ncbi:MAG: DUF4404 family protein [Planctomycetota bacterium]
MDRDQLLQTLKSLHQQLATVDEIGPETRAALADVAGDLERLLDPEDETTADDVRASSEGVRGYLAEFEAEHPQLAESIGRLADGLASLGI